MIPWIQKNDIYEEEGYGKYPILGSPGEYVYFKYDENDSEETCEKLLKRHSPDNRLHAYTLFLGYCGECKYCEGSLDNKECVLYDNYYFYPVTCSKTKRCFYLISTMDNPSYIDEESYIFIPEHPWNAKIFVKQYLNGTYIQF